MYRLPPQRMFVKIEAGPKAGGNDCVYFKTDMKTEFLIRWRWYFEYRAALYKVKNPKHTVHIEFGRYDFIESAEDRRNQLEKDILKYERRIGKIKRNMVKAKAEWVHLFEKVEDTDGWKRGEKRLLEYEQDLAQFKKELLTL